MLDLAAVWLYLFGSGRVPAGGSGRARSCSSLWTCSWSAAEHQPCRARVLLRPDASRRSSCSRTSGLYRIDPTNQDGNPNFVLGHYFPMIYRIPSFGGSSSLTVRSFQEYKDTAGENPRLYDLAGIKYVLQEDNSAPKGFSGPLQKVYVRAGRQHLGESARDAAGVHRARGGGRAYGRGPAGAAARSRLPAGARGRAGRSGRAGAAECWRTGARGRRTGARRPPRSGGTPTTP